MDQTISMIEESIAKQPTLTHHFMKLAKEDRLSHAYLFSGMTGCGKKALAISVTMFLFCEKPIANQLPCGHCTECIRIMAGNNPDVVMETPDGNHIKVDQVRHIKDEFFKSTVRGTIKIFIIDSAEKLTTNAANGLLKFIEEPADNRIIFLLTTNKSLILPTIISRTQLVEFGSLSLEILHEILDKDDIYANQEGLLFALTNSIEDVTEMMEDDWLVRIQKNVGIWYTQLNERNEMSFVTVQTNLMPLANNRFRQAILLDIFVILWQETLKMKYLDYQTVAFPQLMDIMDKTASQVNESKLIQLVEHALQMKKSWESNMEFQNIVETMTLASLDLLT